MIREEIDILYSIAAVLLFVTGLAHSYLGERYILARLFRQNELPKIFGDTTFTKDTLRFAWHLTTIAWWGFAFILLSLADSPPNPSLIGNVIGATFLVHSGVALFGSKGKHLSWISFLLIGSMVVYASNT